MLENIFLLVFWLNVSYPYGTTLKKNQATQVELCPTQDENQLSTSPIRTMKTSITEPFWHYQPSSSMWCHPRLKRNSRHCTMAARWLNPYAPLSKNWGTFKPIQQQHHHTRPHHGYHDSQSLKIHGSTFSLAEMPWCPTSIQIPMAKRHPPLSRLCQQAPCSQTSQVCATFLYLRLRCHPGPMRAFPSTTAKFAFQLARVC